ncbi:hypothetical protein EIP91_001615 [Steccherinum ochraceum]|uniref:Beta-glucuronidase C-terminal domain-containing protein n=1 Tax=Steccherinum ochraceum TaxID=92696 RepID=A0A4R0RG91_9APHY|nr:hypothetical protein EIP91_001615 [Steccherinum ochraceum]
MLALGIGLTCCLLLQGAQAVTVYFQNGAVVNPTGAVTSTAVAAQYTNDAAFNNLVLTAPPVPSPAPPQQFTIQLQQSGQNVQGLSIQHTGPFFGFSIEFSVVTQTVGRNSTFLFVPFLNLMALIAERAGYVPIRVGGNSQDTATLVDSLPDGAVLAKDKADSSNPTQTPELIFTPDIIYMLSNASALVPIRWYLGIPMNDTTDLRLGIAEVAEAVLGDNLLGLQLGNEPDLYAGHGHRAPTYGPFDYFGEFGVVVNAIGNDSNIPIRNNLVAPSVATGPWTPELVWNTGFIPAYSNVLGSLSVEHYPDDNCAAAFPGGPFGAPKVPQDVFSNYLNHTSGVQIVAPYLNSSNIAQQAGKPFVMMETNTASCGGFPGVSDSFGSALWGLDYGLQMAYSNFSQALLHVGGTDDTYNPFTPPPTNQSEFHQWSVGPLSYSTLVMAETLGNTNTSQLIDLNANSGNIYTPAYAIYEKGSLARVALFNYITDPSGASSYTATISIGGGQTGQPNGNPSQVTVKYLVAPSVAEKTNITWAGQTFGGQLASDGRLLGTYDAQTVQCDQTQNTCNVQVPAPGYALVFLTNDALEESTPASTATFSTTILTKTINTATVDPTVIATSNGQGGGRPFLLGSTSKGSDGSAATAAVVAPTTAVLISLLAGVVVMFEVMRRT